ncbi:MAG: tetratricopeptide repeat protein [Reyranella sp.]|nr:tetratricopeptide repeat protein [Reyranella sp.]
MAEKAAHGGTATGRLQLGGLVLDLAAGELLTADHRPAGLRRQALDLLLVLGRRAGQVVGKDELMSLVWPDVVVGEGSLTQAIADVRRALGDTEHRLVRNVARRGYLLAPDTAADSPELSIVVMPLTVEGEVEDNEWFADALHGDLVIEVARLPGSLVIARDTAATYKGKAIDPRQVSRELRVRHVVLGSLRYEGSRIRLNLALVSGDTGIQSWAESFVVERAQLPQSLAEFAIQIERALQPELYRSVIERRAALSPLEVSADDLAMRAFALWFHDFNAQNTNEALKLCERAVALDPDSVRGWWGLSFMNYQGVINRWLPDASAAVRRIDDAAASLGRLTPDGHATYQARVIQAFLKHDLPALLRLTAAWAERHRHPTAFAARGLALLVNGHADEAVAALEKALRLSPRDPIRAEFQYRLAMAHFLAGRYEMAADWGLTAADTNPGLPWPPIHAAAMQRLGRTEAARQAFAEFMKRHPTFDYDHIRQRLPGDKPKAAEGRERLESSLRRIGSRGGKGVPRG